MPETKKLYLHIDELYPVVTLSRDPEVSDKTIELTENELSEYKRDLIAFIKWQIWFYGECPPWVALLEEVNEEDIV